MKMTKVNCSNCNSEFEKATSKVKYFRKKNPNWNFFCKNECYISFKTKKKEIVKNIYKCESCNENFEIKSSGTGGKNRKYCYECFPEGLSKRERRDLRRYLLWSRANKEKISIGCKLCKYNKTGYALEWHHMNDDKAYNPSNLLSKSWEAYQKEVSKCVLLCSNCHREVHAGISKI